MGYEFVGWPADGLWWVEDRASRSCLIATPEQVEAITPMTLAALNSKRDDVCRAAIAMIDKKTGLSIGVSVNDIVDAVFHALATTKVGFK